MNPTSFSKPCVLCLLVLLAAILAGCPFAPEREITLYKPELAYNGITLFGILGQPEFFDLTHGYLNAVRMTPDSPDTARIEPSGSTATVSGAR